MKNASKHVYENNLFSYIFKNPPEIYPVYQSIKKSFSKSFSYFIIPVTCMYVVCMLVCDHLRVVCYTKVHDGESMLQELGYQCSPVTVPNLTLL